MFRGEPIALWTIFAGFVCFLITQFFGILIVGTYDLRISYVVQSHFFLAFFGWLGLTVMGAQLQFYRAITGVRKFEPEWMRWAFLGSLILGLFLMIFGNSLDKKSIQIMGISLYCLGIGIHLFWTLTRVKSRLFKFPLDYFFVAQLFFVVGVLLIFNKILESDVILRDIIEIRHVFLFGWISLTLQGALIRVMPMFLGKTIDRPSRKYLPIHFWFSSLSSFGFVIAFFSGNINLIRPFSTFWFLGWIWTFVILIRSIKFSDLQYKQSLLFLLPGLIYLSVGALIGFYMNETTDPIDRGLRNLHIHLSLVAGLSLVILGAYHRINAFQIYTILYTGKRDSGVSLSDFLYLKYVVPVAILLNLSSLYLAFGFYKNDFTIIETGALLYITSVMLYSVIPLVNILKYLRGKENAIPFWLKSTETN